MSAETDIDRDLAPGDGTPGGQTPARQMPKAPAPPALRAEGPADWQGDDEADHRAGHRKTAEAKEQGTRSARAMRRRWRSPLTRRILALNVLTLVIPIIGLLHLDQYRQSLIHAAHDALRTQGRAFSTSLGSTAAITSQEGEERLLPDITRSLMRVLFSGTGIRARIFAPSGELIADSEPIQ